MGANIFALTNTSETAADLAARCGGKAELVQLLRAAEGTVLQVPSVESNVHRCSADV